MSNFNKEISQLESKINVIEYQNSQLSLISLNSADFDIISFFQNNFLLEKNNSQLNFNKISSTMNLINDIQKQTCEEIAVSVDSNLDKYVEISSKFEKMKNTLTSSQNLYDLLFNEIDETSKNCKINNKSASNLLEKYDLIKKTEKKLKELKKIIKDLKEIEIFSQDVLFLIF